MPNGVTPPRYTLLPDMFLTVGKVCSVCGGLIGDTDVHTDWHKAQGR